MYKGKLKINPLHSLQIVLKEKILFQISGRADSYANEILNSAKGPGVKSDTFISKKWKVPRGICVMIRTAGNACPQLN